MNDVDVALEQLDIRRHHLENESEPVRSVLLAFLEIQKKELRMLKEDATAGG